MASETIIKKKYGVIGAGSFGTVVANLLAENGEVLLYTHNPAEVEVINTQRLHKKSTIHTNITAVSDPKTLTDNCDLIFPVVPSSAFRSMMKDFGPFLKPHHILIHGTKGLDVCPELDFNSFEEIPNISKKDLRRMSQVIEEESIVVKVGCLAGPNLAAEIREGKPAGTVIASKYQEVIDLGMKALQGSRFKVYQNHDLIGVELAGVLKNILAIGSGMISGAGYGENARALLITRGWSELMRIADLFGSDNTAFLGLAGIGDMIATCSSPTSRNYTVGYRLSQGEKIEEIKESMEEVAEGIKTMITARGLIQHYRLRAPIITTFYNIIRGEVSMDKAVHQLMLYPYSIDVNFI